VTGRAVELSVGGMTWASCAARIERKLNRLDGVDASVNFATEKAHVAYSGAVTAEDLVRVVEQTSYTARLSQPLSAAGLGLRLQRGRPAAGRAGAAHPMSAGAAMAFSSVFVVSNSLRLRRSAPSTVDGAGTDPARPGRAARARAAHADQRSTHAASTMPTSTSAVPPRRGG